jgi:hypothetical protein
VNLKAALCPRRASHPEIKPDMTLASTRIVCEMSLCLGHAMRIQRRRFLQLCAGATAVPAVSRVAKAQTYPTRPVRIVVGFGAGGSTLRLGNEGLRKSLGHRLLSFPRRRSPARSRQAGRLAKRVARKTTDCCACRPPCRSTCSLSYVIQQTSPFIIHLNECEQKSARSQ